MKNNLIPTLLCLLMAAGICASATAAEPKNTKEASSLTAQCTTSCGVGFGNATLLNDGWSFRLDDDASWHSVILPHDWSVEGTPSPELFSCTGYLPGGIGHYKRVFAPGELTTEALSFIYFEGVYNRSEVTFNGHLLGTRPSGYASFCYELTPYINADGENILEIKVDHSRQADSRWYTGSGIWRDVWLVTSQPLHFAQWGLTYELTSVDDAQAVLHVGAELTVPDGIKGCKVQFNLTDAQGNKVASQQVEANGSQASAELLVPSPRRWDLDDPYLYTLTAVLMDGKKADDITSCRVGLRTLRFDPNEGFFLNEVNRKVKGVCVHHDAGVLGAAVPEEVWRWRLLQLKELGCNAVRCSHNPQTPLLYDICDELGMLMMDEASDEWEYPKRKWLEGWNKGKPGFEGTFDYFEEWIDRDVADMVCRDRRHPSIFLWSIGNEVDYPNDPYSHPILDGSTINQPMFGGYKPDAPRAERIGEIAKRLAAVVRSHDTTRPVTGALAGVVMSNQTAYPEAVDVVGYNYTEDRYAEDHATYPNRIIYGSENGHGREQWLAVRDNPYIFGQFIWTGIDYLGESGAWPSRGLGTGLLDFCGMPKWQGMMRRQMWREDEVGADNGVAFAMPRGGRRSRQAGGEDAPKIEAAAMRVTVLNDSLPLIDRHAPEHPQTLLLLVEILDDKGNLAPMTNADITCKVEGNGARLLGLETANNSDMTAPKSTTRTTFGGRLLAYVSVPAETADKGGVKDKKNVGAGSEPAIKAHITFSAPGLQDVIIEKY